MAPVQLGKWLVLFCDEINLPDMDNYGNDRLVEWFSRCIPGYLSSMPKICWG